MSSDVIVFHPIGIVSSRFDVPTSPEVMRAAESTIILDHALVEGLTGLEPGQRLMVVFYFDRARRPVELLQHPRGDTTRPRRGLFTLRTPHRPNRIGVSVVDILAIEGNRITVQGLDALDGTPILDLKLELENVNPSE